MEYAWQQVHVIYIEFDLETIIIIGFKHNTKCESYEIAVYCSFSFCI